MEMNLSQRIIIKYYRTKLHLLQSFSPQKAADYALKLFFTPYNPCHNVERPAIFHKGEKLSFRHHENNIHGFRWKSTLANAKTVLICHGMNSCSYRFEKYIQLLLQHNYHVLAFDAQAHGQSEGKILNALIYSEIILAIEKLYGPLYGIIAHSLGGMAATFAMEQLNCTNKKVVIIAPATETSSSLNGFFHLLKLSPSLRPHVEVAITKVRGNDVAWYSSARAVQHIQSKVLWIHDKDDTICVYKDTLPIQKMQLPHVEFMITKGLGHNKIYRDAQVQKTIMKFLDEK